MRLPRLVNRVLPNNYRDVDHSLRLGSLAGWLAGHPGTDEVEYHGGMCFRPDRGVCFGVDRRQRPEGRTIDFPPPCRLADIHKDRPCDCFFATGLADTTHAARTHDEELVEPGKSMSVSECLETCRSHDEELPLPPSKVLNTYAWIKTKVAPGQQQTNGLALMRIFIPEPE